MALFLFFLIGNKIHENYMILIDSLTRLSPYDRDVGSSRSTRTRVSLCTLSRLDSEDKARALGLELRCDMFQSVHTTVLPQCSFTKTTRALPKPVPCVSPFSNPFLSQAEALEYFGSTQH